MARNRTRVIFSPKLVSLAVASCFATSTALANPTGATVVNGQASIQQMGNLLQITNSPNAIINWQSFSINASEITRFLQQGASSAVLNRVIGAGGAIDPSIILGALQSNGRVLLINPSGIVFGAGAQIDVAGLVASSLNLSNQDFLAGRLRFTDGAGAGAVVNQGNINAATGGQVYLVGPSVTNSGVITTPKGEVVLAAGNSVELVNPGTPNLRVEISAPDNEARNLGQIVADAGRVGIYAGLISHSGTIRADSVQVTDDGRIVLKATKNVTLEAGSVTTANGPKGGTVEIESGDTTLVAGAVEATGSADKGGTVHVLGNLVGLTGDASIDASGETGGGTVLVGGDFRGSNPEVRNAFRTYVGPDATIKADAVTDGDGGKVIVWSDDATRFYGSISARGGSQRGDGGFAEVSGKNWLDFHGKVNLAAVNGRAGTLLLDDADVNICNFCSGGGAGFFSGGIFEGGVGTSDIAWGDIITQLGFGNLIITTSGSGGSGDITFVNDGGDPDYASNNMLQFMAHRHININHDITNSGTGDLRFFAGWNGDTGNPGVNALIGDIGINLNKTVRTDGSILMRAGNDISISSGVIVGENGSPGSRSITLDAGNRLRINSADVVAYAGGGDSATINLFAGAGGVEIVDCGECGTTVLADANFIVASPGGPATVNITTTGGGNVTIDGQGCCAVVEARGGAAAGANSAGPGTVNVTSSGGLSILNDGEINTRGGDVNGTGTAGTASVFVTTAGNVLLDNSAEINATGGRVNFGGTGNAGSGFVTVNAGGSLTLTNFSRIDAVGGFVSCCIAANGNGGHAGLFLNAIGDLNVVDSDLLAHAGDTFGAGSSGGSAEGQLSANGSINFVNGDLRVLAGSAENTGGLGGQAVAGLSAGGNINIGSFIFAHGGEGNAMSGLARILMAANGSILVGNGATIRAASATACCTVPQEGGAAEVLMAASHIGISGGSTVRADGGEGQSRGGFATVQLIAGGLASISIVGAEGIGAFGGRASGLNGIGGDALTALVSAGPISLVDTQGFEFRFFNGFPSLTVVGQGVFAVGGPADGSGGLGGNAATLLVSGSGILSQNSHIEAKAGDGQAFNGSAFTGLATLNGNINIVSGAGAATVLACGNHDCAPNVGGPAEVFLEAGGPTGMVVIEDERVEALGSTALINLFFPNRQTGGWSVNGVEGAITGSPVGFFVNGEPAQPGVNFFVEYGAVNISFDAPLQAAIQEILEVMDATKTEDSGTPGDEKKKKDSPPVCG